MQDISAEQIKAVMRASSKGKNMESPQVPPSYAGIVPADVVQLSVGYTEVEREIMALPLDLPTLPAKYKDIPSLPGTSRSSTDFPDGALKDQPALTLKTISDDEIIIIGRSFFGKVGSGLSQKDTASIFTLAFQVSAPGLGVGARIFPNVSEIVVLKDVGYAALDDSIVTTAGLLQKPAESGSTSQVARAYAFLGASLLRLFTQPPENYIAAWKHINSGYARFYGTACPITNVTPHLSVIQTVHDQFSISDLFKSTLYRILYMANKDNSSRSIKNFLFDRHLSHTGMHIVPIFNRVCISLNCEPKTLLEAIYSPMTDRQVSELIDVIHLMGKTDSSHERQMWKYGRIFDSSFFAGLRTKACPKLVYILGCILKLENDKTAENILQIKQLEEVNPQDQKRLQAGAVKLIQAISLATAPKS